MLTLILLVLQVNSKSDTKNINYLKIPFKTKVFQNQNKNKTNYNGSNFLDDYFSNPIFIYMGIGNPLQNITVEIDPNNDSFTFSQKQSHLNLLKDSENNENIISIKPYNIEKSNTSIKKNNTSPLSYIAEDILYINSISNNFKSKFDFNYNSHLINNTNVYCTLGINLDAFNNFSDSQFMEQLKKNNILKKTLISLEFRFNYKGFLHIGPEPHFYDSQKYKEYEFIKTNFNSYTKNNTNKNNTLDWKITFDEVSLLYPKPQEYIEDSQIEKMLNKTAIIDINLGVIIGTKEYYDLLELNYFHSLIEGQVCFKNIVNYKFKNYYVYSCDLDLVFSRTGPYGLSFGFDVGQIPLLRFIHNKLEYNFKLTFHNFFEDIGRMSYFKIIFEVDYNNTVWKLGQPFLRDYQFIFDIKNKTIGFYNPRFFTRKPRIIKKKFDIWKIIIKYGLIFGSIIIFIWIMICFYTKNKQHKKKRINELEEDEKNYKELDDNNENAINDSGTKENTNDE